MNQLKSAMLALAIAATPMFGASDVLAKMDQNAATFSGMSANVKRVSYTKVLDESAEESGTIAMAKQKGKGGLRVVIDFTKPSPRTIAVSGSKAEIYLPKLNQVEEYDLGKHRSLVESFLALGFGTTGKQLSSAYTVKVAGEEKVGGQQTTRLELIPKSAETRERLKRVELWMAESGSWPVQQKFFEASGDSTTVTYADVKLNPPLGADALALNLPKNVKRVHPQK